MDVWHMDIRRFGAALPLAVATRSSAPREVYETYYDIRYPGHERQAGRPLRVSSAYAWHREHGAAFGEKSGLGARQLVRVQRRRAATRRCARAAGRGSCWSPGDRRRARASRERAGAVRRVVVRQDRGRRAGRRGASWSRCATTAWRATSGAITYTQMLNRRGGIECDFTVTRVEEELFPIVTGTAFGNHDLVVDPPPRAARRVGAGRAT